MAARQQCLPCVLAFVVLMWSAPTLAGAAEPQMEKRNLIGPESVRQWSAAESAMETSDVHARDGRRVLRWHVAVDHFAGEAKYPIGWPRVGYSLREAAARDWSGWDYLEMWVYTDTTRQALPREPVGLALYTPDKDSAYRRALTELAKGQWVQIRIPLSQVPRHEDVRLIQLHISESNYRHQDQLDFYIDGVALLRYARPTLLGFSAEQAVMFTDARQLPVRFDLTGIKRDEGAEMTCELRQGGKVIARTAAKVRRGPNRVVLALGGKELNPGEYELVARVAGGAESDPVRVRLVESPWKAVERLP